MNIIRRDIDKIVAYVPGKPIEEVQRELGVKDVIKLASNENPLGPSPKAVAAIKKALGNLHRYPEGSCFYLRRKLAKILGVKETNLIFGNGSDELIDVILKTLVGPDAQIVTADVTFVEYMISGSINGFNVVCVPLKDFTFDLEAIKKAITPNTKAIFIANPNNPTGTYVHAAAVDAFLNSIPDHILVVFDEAYTEYVDAKDFPKTLGYLNKKNVAILRTFSKIYGLAGLRIGYMIASDDFIACCERVRQPFNVNALAQVAGLAALDDKAFVSRSVRTNRREKTSLYRALKRLDIWFKESQTNFIFVKMNATLKDVFPRLLKKGVIIRDMRMYKDAAYARITVGTQKENARLIRALQDMTQETA